MRGTSWAAKLSSRRDFYAALAPDIVKVNEPIVLRRAASASRAPPLPWQAAPPKFGVAMLLVQRCVRLAPRSARLLSSPIQRYTDLVQRGQLRYDGAQVLVLEHLSKLQRVLLKEHKALKELILLYQACREVVLSMVFLHLNL